MPGLRLILALLLALTAAVPRAGAEVPANPPLAMGLNGITDWTAAQPFIDVMKTARPWIGHPPGQWGGWYHEDLAAGGYLDPDGWPLAIPPELTGIATRSLTDRPEDATATAGRYRLTYQGEGSFTLDGRVQNLRTGRGLRWFDFSPGEGFVLLTITASDPRRVGNPIRDIVVVKEANIPAYEAGEMFNPDWLARIEGLRAVRFMDWMKTNDSAQSDWAARPRVGDYTYARIGAPVEVMLALAARIGADPWFTLPHLASDDYMLRFAETVRGGLAPGLKAYVEFSNEVWNWQFGQARWAEDQGKARWGREHAWVQFYAVRAAQMARIWREVFGDQAADRLVTVIATQTGWLGLEADLLNAPLWRAEDPAHRPPAEDFDAYAVTGYFGGQLGSDAKAPAVKAWLAASLAAAEAGAQGLAGAEREAYLAAHRYDLATRTAARELRDGSVTGRGDDSLATLVGRLIPYHAEVARAHGLDLIMYEGGTHVVGLGTWVDDKDLTGFFAHLNYSPAMGDLYRDLLTGWRAAGGTLFNAFVEVAAPGKWGSWGALRHLSDDNPRWQALDRFNRTTEAWWEDRRLRVRE